MIDMRRILCAVSLCLFPLLSSGQTYKMYQTENYHNQLRLNTVTGEVMQVQDNGLIWIIVNDIDPDGEYKNRFRLYKTKNMWNFIELDTFTGRLWQVQYSVDGDEYRFAFPINRIALAQSERKSIFTIHPMTSMYQYYLINEATGEMWMFQWSTEGDNYRWIEKVNQ